MRIGIARVGVALMAAFTGTAATAASDADVAKQDRIDELERKVEVLTEELAALREQAAVPDEAGLESYAGLGPAASRVYDVARGLSIGGYAEAFYRNAIEDGDVDGVDTTDALRMVLYAGYKFTDRIVFNSEIEFEHGTTGNNLDGQAGSVSVELMTLDFLWKDWANSRTGLLLVPSGFLNEVHEPPFFHGVSRPQVEQVIIPTTWRENGTGVFGRVGESLEYRAYALTGLDAAGLTPSAIRGARSNGNRSRAEDLAGIVRVDWTPLEGLLLGGSFYGGGIDQSRSFSSGGQTYSFDDASLLLWELHAQYRWQGLELRALYAQAFLDGAEDITSTMRAARRSSVCPASASQPCTGTIAEDWLGWYVEAAYDVMPWIAPDRGWYLAPFFRFEWYDTQYGVPDDFERDRSKRVRLYTPGITFKPHPNVALKIDYRNFAPREGEQADEVEIGFGVAF
jgi:hypothetical protein